jgi:hypothetical protein
MYRYNNKAVSNNMIEQRENHMLTLRKDKVELIVAMKRGIRVNSSAKLLEININKLNIDKELLTVSITEVYELIFRIIYLNALMTHFIITTWT